MTLGSQNILDLLGSPLRYRAKRGHQIVLGAITGPATLHRILTNTRSWQLYCQLNPGGITSDTITAWRCVLVDLDAAPEDGLNNFLTILGSYFPCPIDPDIIDSGRGLQLWLRFAPKAIRDEERSAIRKATGAFLRNLRARTASMGFVVDLSTSDLARCGRMPGSVNQKTGRTARILHVGAAHSAAVPETILGMVGPSPARGLVPAVGRWQEIWPHLTSCARLYLEHGAENGDRHRSSWHTAASLCEAHVPYATALRLCLRGNDRCPEPLDDDEIERQVRSAYRQKGTYNHGHQEIV